MTNVRKPTATLLGVVTAAVLMLCGAALAGSPNDVTVSRYLQIKERHEAELRAIPGVEGLGVGLSTQDTSQAVIRIYVDRSITAQARQALPTALESAPVEVVESVVESPQ